MPQSVARVRRSQELRDRTCVPERCPLPRAPFASVTPRRARKMATEKGGVYSTLDSFCIPGQEKVARQNRGLAVGTALNTVLPKRKPSSGCRQSQWRNGSPSTLHTSFSSMQILCGPSLPPLPGLFPQNKFTSLHTVCDLSAPERRTQELCLQWEPELQRRLGSPHQYSR